MSYKCKHRWLLTDSYVAEDAESGETFEVFECVECYIIEVRTM